MMLAAAVVDPRPRLALVLLLPPRLPLWWREGPGPARVFILR